MIRGLIAALLVTVASSASAATSVSYTEPVAAGVRLKVVTVDVRDPRVRIGVVLAHNRIGASERFASMVARSGTLAAITGTFFSTRSYLPTGDIVVGGKQVWNGRVGTAVTVSADNDVRFVDVRRNAQKDWSAYQTVIRGGPRLVRNGRVWVCPKAEGFRDPSLFKPRPRTAVAIKKDGRLLLVVASRPVTLSKLAKALVALGARDAIAMDGGSSTGLYYRGSFIALPARKLTNMLAVRLAAPAEVGSTRVASAAPIERKG